MGHGDNWGVVYGTKEFLPIKQAGEGHQYFEPVWSDLTQPTQSAYNASVIPVVRYRITAPRTPTCKIAVLCVTCVHPGGIRTNIAKAARMSDSIKRLDAQKHPEL
jgi:hypothetical protein